MYLDSDELVPIWLTASVLLTYTLSQ